MSKDNQGGMILFEGKYPVMILMPDDVDFEFKGDYLASAKDIAFILEYSQTNDFVSLVKDKYIYKVKNSNLAKPQNRKLHNTGELFVSSFGINQGVSNSTMPKAEPFQDWLFEDLIPSVQKHGIYATDSMIERIVDDPEFGIQVLTKLQEERAARKKAENTIEEQKPLVGFAEICLQSDQSIKVRDLAHSLTSHGLKIGQGRLYDKLREWKKICQGSTEPTQTAVEQGLFEVVTGVKQKPTGEPFTWRTTYVTVKGQIYIADRLRKESGA